MSSQQMPDCGPDCQRALAKLEAYLDGELPDASVEQLRDHLRSCYPCTDRASFEEQLRALVRRDCVDHAPPDLLTRVRERLLSGELSPDERV